MSIRKCSQYKPKWRKQGTKLLCENNLMIATHVLLSLTDSAWHFLLCFLMRTLSIEKRHSVGFSHLPRSHSCWRAVIWPWCVTIWAYCSFTWEGKTTTSAVVIEVLGQHCVSSSCFWYFPFPFLEWAHITLIHQEKKKKNLNKLITIPQDCIRFGSIYINQFFCFYP